jgi:hypothetical protein
VPIGARWGPFASSYRKDSVLLLHQENIYKTFGIYRRQSGSDWWGLTSRFISLSCDRSISKPETKAGHHSFG